MEVLHYLLASRSFAVDHDFMRVLIMDFLQHVLAAEIGIRWRRRSRVAEALLMLGVSGMVGMQPQ